MGIQGQTVIPAVREIKDFERLLSSKHKWIILLHSHIAQIASLAKLARDNEKQMILHADLVRGLKRDESAAQFLCHAVRPAGIISTHATMLSVAKKRGLITVLRVFLLDSSSLETSYRVLESCNPDYLEVLPGLLPGVLREVKATTGKPIIAGGFIRTAADVDVALTAGATAVSTSNPSLWMSTCAKPTEGVKGG